MALSLPILNRARKWGYIFWKKENDLDVRNYLKEIDEVNVIFEGKEIGKKRIDWNYRRISIGWKNTRNLAPDKKEFVLTLYKDGRLVVKCL